MHGEVPLSLFLILLGFAVRYAVPLACAAIALDAARRPLAAFGSQGRTPWVAIPLSILVLLIIGFIVPSPGPLGLFAIAAVPVTSVLGVAYLFKVVFPAGRGR